MELARLIAILSDPKAHPRAPAVDAIEVHQTHVSVVFLVGSRAYKIKKPVTLGFLDYGTLERRHRLCEEEVRINRRLAPSVYLGVVAVTRDGDVVEMEGRGEVIEWAVKMERLPDSANLRERLVRGEVGVETLEAVALRIAEFHASARGGPAVAASGRFDIVAANARGNIADSASHVGSTVSHAVHERVAALTERALLDLRPMIGSRAEGGKPRDGHGDLRLEHVYLFADRAPPSDLLIIDAIEFDERFRHADPVADMAFLVMDLAFEGRRDLACAFANAYFAATDDAEGRALLPFYTSYRAAVRAKVEGMRLAEPEVPEAERAQARDRARALWLLALGGLEDASRRPCLVLVGGLPGVGKSTVAGDLAELAGFEWMRSDRVRKDLAGLSDSDRAPSAFGEGLYTPEWNERTHAECRRRAEALLLQGKRVVVDASFRTESSRRLMLDVAARLRVPGLFLLCRAEPSVVRERLASRRDDASDADWTIHLEILERWEEPSADTSGAVREVDAGASRAATLASALQILREWHLAAETPTDAPAAPT